MQHGLQLLMSMECGYLLNIVSCIQLPNIASLQSDKFSHNGVHLSHLIAEVSMSTGT